MQRIPKVVKLLGISPEHKGYQFLVRAIELTMEDYEYAHSVTKTLYPTIAREFGVNHYNVDTNIRRAVECGWHNADPICKLTIFGNTVPPKSLPTTSCVVATIADYLKRNKGTSEENVCV